MFSISSPLLRPILTYATKIGHTKNKQKEKKVLILITVGLLRDKQRNKIIPEQCGKKKQYYICKNQTKTIRPTYKQNGLGETTKNMPGQQIMLQTTARRTSKSKDISKIKPKDTCIFPYADTSADDSQECLDLDKRLL